MTQDMAAVTRFQEAARTGEIEAVIEMIKKAEKDGSVRELIETRSLEGKNSLHQSVESSQAAVVKLLLEHGADPEVNILFVKTHIS